MESRKFRDRVRQGRGFWPSAPLHGEEIVGDAALAGANCLFSEYGQIRSWRGFSPANSPGAKLLHLVGGVLAGSQSGNIWKQHGEAVFFIGSGKAFVDDFFNPIGIASSQLQVRIGGQTYQGGLPQPSAPGIEIARDSAGQPIGGQITGAVSAKITRIRTVTGAESASSDTSATVVVSNGRIRLTFPAALGSQGQDEWGLYLTRHGFGGAGPHLFFKQIKEAEIAPLTLGVVAAGAGNGGALTFGGTTPNPVHSRRAIIVLNPAAGALPAYVTSGFAMTPGPAASIRVQKPVGAQNGHYMTVMIIFKAEHRLIPEPTNKGIVTIASVTGVWELNPPLNPQAQNKRITVVQDSTTTFKWKFEDESLFSPSLPLTTTPTALSSTGLAISWTDTISSAEEVGNTFTIEPFSLIPPDGWGNEPVEWIGNLNDTIGIGIYGRVIDASLGEFAEWVTSSPTIMNSLAVVWTNVNNGSPVGNSAAQSTSTPQTTHNTTLPPSAPATTQLVTYWFAGETSAPTFTPTAPLAAIVSTDQLARRLDVDYVDDDLNENFFAPKDVEGPPAGSHGFPFGELTVVAGALGGTALAPSRPNQPEQYDLSQATFLNPPEPIVRCEISPFDGSIYIWTRNSLQTVINTGDNSAPVLPRTIWPQTGIANPSGACLSKNGAYAATGKSGFARYVGSLQPDTEFADPVREYVKDWQPEDTVTGYDGILNAVAYCHWREILLYFESFGVWSPPLKLDVYDFLTDPDLQARIVSCATVNGRLHFCIQTGADSDEDYEIFVFDVGLGGEWFLRSVNKTAGAADENKTIRRLRLVADFSSEQELEYFNFNSLERRTDRIVMSNPTVAGYCVGKLAIPKYWTDQGLFRLEWTITTPQLGERWVAFTDSVNLAKYGSPFAPLPGVDYDTNSLFAWRVDSSGMLTWYLAGSGTAHATVQEGDVVRIEWDANGDAIGTLLRNGSPVGSPFDFGAPGGGWPLWLGFKLGLASGGTVSLGKLSFVGQTGRLRVWKNFGAERGGMAAFDQTLQADGDKHYDWAKPRISKVVTYNIEVGGNSADQEVSAVYVKGRISGRDQSLLTQ